MDLTLHLGEMCALIGPSGAGKSTLIKALLGLRDPDDGSVTMGSAPVADLGPVGYLPQDDTLHRALTVQRGELGYAADLRMPGVGTEDRESPRCSNRWGSVTARQSEFFNSRVARESGCR